VVASARWWNDTEDPRRLGTVEAGPLRMSERDAADVVWALARSTGFYRNLTVDRGWSRTRAFRALNDAIARTVLAE
jgi:hypothetical protein